MRLLPEIRNLIGNYHVKSGVYHYYRDEYGPAVDFLRKALTDEAQLTGSDLRKARHYLTLALMDSAERQQEKGGIDQAISELRDASEVSPNFPDIHFRLGRLLEERLETRAAASEYAAAIRCNPDYLEAHVALGFCLITLGCPDEAVPAMQRAREIRLQLIEAPFSAGLAALGSGDQPAARELFHEAFLAARRLSVEHMKAAQNLMRAGDHQGALREFDRAAELTPKFADVHNYRGIALCELDRVGEAIDAFGLSSARSPGYLVPRLNLTFAWLRAGDVPQAEAALKAVLEIDPSETAAAAKLEELVSVRVPEKRRSVSRGTVR